MAEDKKDEQPKQAAPAQPAAKAAPSEAAPKAAAPAKPAGPAPLPWQSEIADAVRSAFPEGPLEALTYLGQNFLVVPSERILPVAMFLKSELGFDMLADLTAVDYPKREKRFEVIYELYSFPRNERLRLKAPLGDGETIESVVSVWGVADWLERECFDMFGIRFANHPNLKRILLPDEWEGYPLRKDYGILQQDAKWVRENLHIESGQ